MCSSTCCCHLHNQSESQPDVYINDPTSGTGCLYRCYIWDILRNSHDQTTLTLKLFLYADALSIFGPQL